MSRRPKSANVTWFHDSGWRTRHDRWAKRSVPNSGTAPLLTLLCADSLEATSPVSSPTFFASADAFRSWLAANASSASELLVGYHKVGSSLPSMSWPDSVDQALCFGWIDGVRRRIDDTGYSIRFTPRKAASIWSAVNIGKYQKLLGAGLITPAGAAAFAHRTAAKTAVYAYEQSTVAELAPEELRLFQLQPVAWAFFQATPPSYRKVILHWITSAKKDQTRSARFDQLLAACVDGLRLR